MKPPPVIAAVPIAFCLVAPLGCSGCTERPEEQPPAKAAPAPSLSMWMKQPRQR